MRGAIQFGRSNVPKCSKPLINFSVTKKRGLLCWMRRDATVSKGMCHRLTDAKSTSESERCSREAFDIIFTSTSIGDGIESKSRRTRTSLDFSSFMTEMKVEAAVWRCCGSSSACKIEACISGTHHVFSQIACFKSSIKGRSGCAVLDRLIW